MKQFKENEETRLKAIQAGELNPDSKDEFFLPSIPYGQCRQIMTRTDFLNGTFAFDFFSNRCVEGFVHGLALTELDRQNIISIDVRANPSHRTFFSLIQTQVHHNVRPDSMLVLQAAREVVESEGFDELLDSVRDRIDEIESLHRTRELTVRSP